MNLLKKWETPSAICGMATEVDASEEEIPDWRGSEPSHQPTIGSQLTEAERAEIQNMLTDFQDVMQSKPGRTTLTEHTILIQD